MNRPESYNTKQREMILNYIASLGGAHVTAAQILENFEKDGVHIGRTTIYRHLDKLTEGRKILRYINDGVSGACYQYVGDGGNCGIEGCRAHMHLKCETCGELLHLDCDMISEIQQHFCDVHAFRVNAYKLVIYGECDNCYQKGLDTGKNS